MRRTAGSARVSKLSVSYDYGYSNNQGILMFTNNSKRFVETSFLQKILTFLLYLRVYVYKLVLQ